MQKFTVVAFIEDTGQIVCHHVHARDALNAFAAATSLDMTMTMVAALPGWLHEGEGVTFPGEGLVDAQTVLDQPEVFGAVPTAHALDFTDEAAGDSAPVARVVIDLDGGLVQNLVADVPLEYVVFDRDVEGCDDEDVVERPSPFGGGSVRVYRSGVYAADCEADKVASVYQALAVE